MYVPLSVSAAILSLSSYETAAVRASPPSAGRSEDLYASSKARSPDCASPEAQSVLQFMTISQQMFSQFRSAPLSVSSVSSMFEIHLR